MLPESQGRPARGARRPALCKQEKGPGLLSFPENLCAGQREPLSPGLPGLLPRTVAQVSHAAPSPGLFSPFVCGITASWPWLPSLTPPLWASASDHCFSEMNLYVMEMERPEAAVRELWVLLPLAPHSSPVAKSGPQSCGWGPGALPGFIPGSFGISLEIHPEPPGRAASFAFIVLPSPHSHARQTGTSFGKLLASQHTLPTGVPSQIGLSSSLRSPSHLPAG